jgi:hypothetical protein
VHLCKKTKRKKGGQRESKKKGKDAKQECTTSLKKVDQGSTKEGKRCLPII